MKTDETNSGNHAVNIVAEFWRRMATNDFRYAAALLSDHYTLDWPQSGERIRGRERFAQMNIEYPAADRWTFTVHRIVGSDVEAVSDVSVTDGVKSARAITFSRVDGDLIASQVEFWPEPMPPQANRSHLVEP